MPGIVIFFFQFYFYPFFACLFAFVAPLERRGPGKVFGEGCMHARGLNSNRNFVSLFSFGVGVHVFIIFQVLFWL